MHLLREIVWGAPNNPLIVLDRLPINPVHLDLEPARQELLGYAQERGGASGIWGYFPEFAKPEEYPDSRLLADQLQHHLVEKKLGYLGELHLGYLRAGQDEPINQFGGLHFETSPGTGLQRDADAPEGAEVVRIICNLHPTESRVIDYARVMRSELESQGITVNHAEYQTLEIPAEIERRRIEIPPRRDNAVFCLQLWSSLVPHAGVPRPEGHFLAAYGGYRQPAAFRL